MFRQIYGLYFSLPVKKTKNDIWEDLIKTVQRDSSNQQFSLDVEIKVEVSFPQLDLMGSVLRQKPILKYWKLDYESLENGILISTYNSLRR